MISLIGFTIDLISFVFAVLVLPICTAVFWLSYDDQKDTDAVEDCSTPVDEKT